MTAYAIIQDGAVVNIAEADDAFAQAHGWVLATGARIGDLWDGTAFSTPDANPAIPASVTRRQARQALLLAGLLASVQPAIDAIADATERGLMQIWWDDSLDFERSNSALITMATALGLDSAGIDDLFILAATL